MDPDLLYHAGNAFDKYWWLVFPAWGLFVTTWAGRSMARSSRRRQERRHELKMAKYGQAGSGSTKQNRQRSIAQAQRVMDDHAEVTARWLDYETDVAKLIDFPMMSDVREPMTVEFLRAKRTADGLRPGSAEELIDDGGLEGYRAAVERFEVAFDVAEREAQRVRDSHFSEAERARLATARRFVKVAEDPAASPNERQMASKRARREVEGIIVLRREAVAELERRAVLGITTSRPARSAG